MSKNSFKIITLNKENIIDFAKERNLLLGKSKSDWVLFLDTDEKITSELKKEIDEAIKSEKFNGYFIKRKNYFLGKYSGMDKIVRLAKREKGHWVRPVHEVWKVKGELGYLRSPIIHNTSDNVADMVRKINFYSTLHAKANRNEGKKVTLTKIVLFPTFKFFQSLLSGRGLILSMLQSFHSFLSWSKQWELLKD